LLLCTWPLKLLLRWEWLFGRLACFLTEGKGATASLWFWESWERETVKAGVQGRLVCEGFERGEGWWWNGCWEGNVKGRRQQLSLLREMREETGRLWERQRVFVDGQLWDQKLEMVGLGLFRGWGEGKALVGKRGKWNRKEKAGIGEKGVLVLWSGVCGGAVTEMEKWRGSLVADLREEDWRTGGDCLCFIF
jgi:hypothetical protein